MMPTKEAHHPKAPTPYLIMHDMMYSAFVTQAIYVVAQLGIADLLKNGPKSAAELAQTTDVGERTLYRVLRFLVSRNVFSEDAEGRFASTSLARRSRPGRWARCAR